MYQWNLFITRICKNAGFDFIQGVASTTLKLSIHKYQLTMYIQKGEWVTNKINMERS